jgi:EAL domain-containing protein (putative c-di-GMP-specific phosphodiesterase class I)
VLAFVVSTVPGVRDDERFHVAFDGWLQGGAYVVAAVLLGLRPLLHPHLRLIWGLAAAALTARALAFVWYLAVVRLERPMPYPSPADAGWLLMCVLLLVALSLQARLSSRQLSVALLLDGVIGAAATAAVAIALLGGTLRRLTAHGLPRGALVTNTLYPALDIALLVMVVGVLLAYSWSPPPAVWVSGLGVAGFAALDSAYLYAVAHGTWHPGSPLAALSLLSTAVIAFSGWMPPRHVAKRNPDYLPGVVVPSLLATSCVAVLVWAGLEGAPVASVVLAAVGTAAGMVRAVVAHAHLRGLLGSDAPVDPMAEELRTAIRAGELVLHYQPLVSLVDGRVVGIEALVRWQHPARGLLPPGDFLDTVDRAGLLPELTASVLDTALAQVARWRGQGHDPVVSVNLSVRDLLDPGFPFRVEALLLSHGLPGTALVLELTEDLLLADPALGCQVIAALLERDVKVQVDDYGTGYSTLGYLRDLPDLGGLKLDRSFITHLDSEPRSAAIVASTVRLARSLGIEVIAEGVETVAVRDQLASLGCELAQGYLFACPVPAEQVSFEPVPGAVPD